MVTIRVFPPLPEGTASATLELRFKPEELQRIVEALSPKAFARSSSVVIPLRGQIEVDLSAELDAEGFASMRVGLSLL